MSGEARGWQTCGRGVCGRGGSPSHLNGVTRVLPPQNTKSVHSLALRKAPVDATCSKLKSKAAKGDCAKLNADIKKDTRHTVNCHTQRAVNCPTQSTAAHRELPHTEQSTAANECPVVQCGALPGVFRRAFGNNL